MYTAFSWERLWFMPVTAISLHLRTLFCSGVSHTGQESPCNRDTLQAGRMLHCCLPCCAINRCSIRDPCDLQNGSCLVLMGSVLNEMCVSWCLQQQEQGRCCGMVAALGDLRQVTVRLQVSRCCEAAQLQRDMGLK